VVVAPGRVEAALDPLDADRFIAVGEEQRVAQEVEPVDAILQHPPQLGVGWEVEVPAREQVRRGAPADAELDRQRELPAPQRRQLGHRDARRDPLEAMARRHRRHDTPGPTGWGGRSDAGCVSMIRPLRVRRR
jgi:hypothetical protein